MATTALPRSRRAAPTGLAPRVAVSGLIVLAVFLLPLVLEDFEANQITKGVIWAVIGLSLNVLLGHAGQISLGHQAFVGVGAFASGALVTNGMSFYMALPLAGLIGATAALLLGLVALRISGLYLALITLAFGNVAEESIFNIPSLTRGGAGMPAPRPALFQSDVAYLYLCLIVLAIVLLIDWRLMKSKAGRAILVIRHDERVAATTGVNVTFYKTLAFMISGFLAGVAGSLFAHWQTVVVANDFVFSVALIWVFMTVVGGLESRAGVVIGSAFFALFHFIIENILDIFVPTERAVDITTDIAVAIPLIGAVLLVLTLTLYPGGIGQQLLPIRRWLAGGSFRHHARSPAPELEEEVPTPPGAEASGGRKQKLRGLLRRRGRTTGSDGAGAHDEGGPSEAGSGTEGAPEALVGAPGAVVGAPEPEEAAGKPRRRWRRKR